VITGATKLVAVLGYPILHSQSPQMHNAAFAALGIDAVMVPLAIAPADFAKAVETLCNAGFLGASVTTPHKDAAFNVCHQLAPSAQHVGAVNCLQFVASRIIGHNTDGDGFANALAQAGVSVSGKQIVILGAGGAARAVAYGVRQAAGISVFARRPATVSWTTALPWQSDSLRPAFASADIVVDCTSTAVSANNDDSQFVDSLPLSELRTTAAVCSLTYHCSTALAKVAAARGLITHDGKGMLLAQGAIAFGIWTGQPAPLEIMRAALRP
jgi:shikimate dehydrogenase